MSHLTHPTHLQSPETNGQSTPNRDSPHWSTPIHVLDDDSLLNIFCLFRSDSESTIYDVDDEYLDEEDWRHDERCWYQLAQVCRRWRCIILSSASYLQVFHVCTYGRPVADMLAHSPHLPIVLDYIGEKHAITPEDEEGIMLALQQRHRVRHIRLLMPGSNLQKLLLAIDGQFPMLELLFVKLPNEDRNNTNLILPTTLEAPRLRRLVLTNIKLSPALQILTTCVSLVTLALYEAYPAYFSPNDLLQHLSLLPQLKSFIINFQEDVPVTVIGRELLDAPVMTRVTFPNLRRFQFAGPNAYLEVLLSCITTPILETLEVFLFPQVTFSTLNLLQFVTLKNFKLTVAKFIFDDMGVNVEFYPDDGTEKCSLLLDVACINLDSQVSSLVQIFDDFEPVLSAVERLAFSHENNPGSVFVTDNEVDPFQWHRLLRSFRNVKALLIDDVLARELSRYFQSDDEGFVLELLPELKELSYFSGPYQDPDWFNEFINARQVAGLPVTLIRH